MAKVAQKIPKQPRKRTVDPAGRVDILAIRLLEKLVETHGDLPMRGIYGTYKGEIDRAIKLHLGKFRVHVAGLGQIRGTSNAR